MEAVLLDKWTSMFLAWPTWVPCFYVRRVASIKADPGIVLSRQIVASLRRDFAGILAASEAYNKGSAGGSLRGFVDFISNNKQKTGDEKWKFLILGIVRLIKATLIRGHVDRGGAYAVFHEAVKDIYNHILQLELDEKAPKLVSYEVCKKPLASKSCPTRGLLKEFVASETFRQMLPLAERFLLEDVIPRLVKLCSAALLPQVTLTNPGILIASSGKTATYLKRWLPHIRHLLNSSDPLQRATAAWTSEAQYLLKARDRLFYIKRTVDNTTDGECLCRRLSEAVLLALVMMDQWAGGGEVCGFHGTRCFLSFDRVWRFLGPNYIVGLNNNAYGVEPRGEEKMNKQYPVSLIAQSGRRYDGQTMQFSRPFHGLRIHWPIDVRTDLEFCREAFNLKGIGWVETQVASFSQEGTRNINAFRSLDDLCQDGLEQLYVFS
jgi:hypothetical protein